MKSVEMAPTQANCDGVALYIRHPVVSRDPGFFSVGPGDKEKPLSVSTSSLLGGLAG